MRRPRGLHHVCGQMRWASAVLLQLCLLQVDFDLVDRLLQFLLNAERVARPVPHPLKLI